MTSRCELLSAVKREMCLLRRVSNSGPPGEAEDPNQLVYWNVDECLSEALPLISGCVLGAVLQADHPHRAPRRRHGAGHFFTPVAHDMSKVYPTYGEHQLAPVRHTLRQRLAAPTYLG